MNNKEKIAFLEKRIQMLERILEKYISPEEIATQLLQLEDCSTVFKCDFFDKNSENIKKWHICNADKVASDRGIAFKSKLIEKVFGFMYDPMIVNSNMNIPTDKVKFVHIRIKSNVDATRNCFVTVYYTTNKKHEWNQAQSSKMEYTAGKTEDVYIEMNGENWSGILKQIRIDPVEGMRGSVEISLVELVGLDGEILYSYDFSDESNENSDEWIPRNVTVIGNKGSLFLDIDIIDKMKEFSDPFIYCDGLRIPLDNAKYLHMSLRTDIENEAIDSVLMQVFFKTNVSNSWSQEKCIPFRYEQGKDIDVYLEIRHLFWKGELIALRIDPFENLDGKTELMKFELLPSLPDGKNVYLLENKSTSLENRFAKIYGRKR